MLRRLSEQKEAEAAISGIRFAGAQAEPPARHSNVSLTHRFLLGGFLFELPLGKGKALFGNANRMEEAILGGWQLGGIFTLEGGFPLSVNCTSNATYENTDSGCRADVTGQSPQLSNRSPNAWFNTAAFVNRTDFVAGIGPYRFGTSGRNVVIGPGSTALDASISKAFRTTERSRLDFRAEFFNLPNHPILGQPGGTVGTSTYGVISSTKLDSRQIQSALKLSF